MQGCALYFTDQGSGDAVVLIHGTGANADIWADALALIAAEHRVIAYDRRGFSRSLADPVRDWSLHYSDAIELIERLGAQPATVVGWSSGGPIALEVARQRPDLVKALVLLEAAMPLMATLTPSGLRLVLQGKVTQLIKGDRETARWFYRWATSYRSGGNSFDLMGAALQEAELANATPAMEEIEGARRGAGHLGAATLRRITVPAFCVFGEDVAHGWYRRTTRYLAQSLPRGRLRSIPGASHAAFLDQPQAFAAIVTEAIESAG